MALYVDGARFQVEINIPERKTALGLDQSPSYKDHVMQFIARYTSGVGANKVDAVYSTRQALSGNTDFDLRGVLTSVLDGSVVSFPLVMGVFIVNYSTTPGEHILVGGGSNPWISHLGASGDIYHVDPGGFDVKWSPIEGWATTAGTGDILRLAPATGTPTIGLLIVGRAS